MGPVRVWLQDEDVPGLAMTRSIGDGIAKDIGVTAEPEIKSYFITDEDKFLLVASDGIWEYISNDKVNITLYYFLIKCINIGYKYSTKIFT